MIFHSNYINRFAVVLLIQIQMQKHNKYIEAPTYKNNPYIEFIGKFKEIHPLPTTLQQLADGLVLLELVRLIKDLTIVGQIQDNPRTFSHRFSNFKLLFKSIEAFWQNVLGCQIEGDEIDLVQLAHTNCEEQLDKILELFIKTAAQAENKFYFIQKILQTSQTTQQYLKSIIEKVLGNQSKESPRKEKEKRMYDKILELDHQNDKLQQVIEIICDEKLQLEGKVRIISDQLIEKNKQIQKLQNMLKDQDYTPQKRRMIGIPDTIERKQTQIESLRQQILQISANHQKQLQNNLSEMEKMMKHIQKYQQIKNQLELNRAIIESNKEIIAEAQDIEKGVSHLKAELMNKDNYIEELQGHKSKLHQKVSELQKDKLELTMDVQRKSMQINELSLKLQNIEKKISPKKGEMHNTLFFEFPQIINTEADAYIETNRNLREEMERTRKRLQKSEQQLDRCKSELDSLKNSQIQNKKLREMVLELKTHRGEQNDVLVQSLFYMRKLLKQNNSAPGSALKDMNRLNRNLFSKCI